MAQTHVDRFDVRPLVTTAAQRQHALQRTHNMLVIAIIGTMIVIVVAALFMTMF